MNLSESLFESYWGNKINLDEFIDRVGFKEENFIECLQTEIEKTKISHNAGRLSNLLYVLFIWKDRFSGNDISKLENFLKILDDLLIEDWHTQHGDIAILLQSISNVESLEYLFKAIELKPEYLSWDDNYAFEVRCVRAIYYIGKEKSVGYLEKLCKHENEIIRKIAQREMKKLI